MVDSSVATSFLQSIDIGLRGLLFTKFYDILKLTSVNEGVVLYPKEIALREMAEKREEVAVEMISLWKVRIAPDWKRMRTPVARRGMLMNYVNTSTKLNIGSVKAVPVALGYNVWFWTHYRERFNQIAERYLFWQQDNPNLNLQLTVTYTDNGDVSASGYPVEFDIHFGELTDESIVVNKYDEGQYFVLNTPITIDGWAFVTGVIPTAATIKLTIYDKNDLTTLDEYSEIIVEDSSQDVELEVALKLSEKVFT